ncbi:phosphotransferase [Streptomyces turgidiscabies]|uniref:Phosphotransferase enzyme family protein n=1 Tax=Streptomyces turgidiscabies (strain Car8) TaxID=698760 RepID=L7EVV1_STRT8|nr:MULTISPECIES: phosphotransferase [Streptomyces]ELP62836.1 phosphotransferase enzyme family protein [Streptomyces turgidiscabies Car8]MDX3492206.1 phosphotransferase [Streptomyces turgidiscabies]
MPRSSVPPLASHAPPLGALLRQYAAGSALTCEPVDQGLLNRGYRLATTRGHYFLKHHFDPETADPAAIARQHRATQRLADLGVPVAPPLPGRDGRTVAVVGGNAYALHPWIDGRHRHGGQLSTVQCGRLGALLGVVHASLERVMPTRGRAPDEHGDRRTEGDGTAEGSGGRERGAPQRVTADRGRAHEQGVADGFVRPGRADREEEPGRPITVVHPRDATRQGESTGRAANPVAGRAKALTHGIPVAPPQHPPGARPTDHSGHSTGQPLQAPSADPADTFALIDDLLAHVRRHRPTDAFDELARHRLLERRALLEQHADRRPPPGGSVGWVHGDFHPFNLLYKGDAPAAIVDWDRLGVQPRAEEAVRAAAIFFVRPAGTLDLPKARAYARAYRRAAGATPSELAAAVHRVWWERLNDFWMLRWHYERGDTRADSQFPAASALAVWWTREYDVVCGAFVD